MTVIAQDDHLTAGAWAACETSNLQIKFCCAILWPLGGSMVNNKTQLDELMKKPLQFSSV